MSPSAVTFALDTCTPYLTLALNWEGGSLAFSEEVGRAHAELLADTTKTLFNDAGLPFRANTIVIGTGPGSYTGVRIGASYALGLARIWGATVLGVPTLEGLVSGDGPQAVSMDARKGNVYSAIYEVEGGVVSSVKQLPSKQTLEEFVSSINNLPHQQDVPLNGLSLLRAGLKHGIKDWNLSYL